MKVNPMATPQTEEGKKFHLPEWMTQNIGRLGTSTDLDEYACSVLESEGYLSERLSEAKLSDSYSSLGVGAENTNLSSLIKPAFEESKTNTFAGIKYSARIDRPKLSCTLSSKHLSAVDAIKYEEGAYSSPDSTPCVTPEQSPVPQRKKSLTCHDTVQSNPQKWFYLGTAKNTIISKQLKKKCVPKSPNQPTTAVESGVHAVSQCNAGNSGVKLTVSNFDLNAISPSSW